MQNMRLFFILLLTFYKKLFRIYIDIFKINNLEVVNMKKRSLMLIIGVVTIVAAICAAATAFFVVKEKQKKDDEELMEYLDNSIE